MARPDSAIDWEAIAKQRIFGSSKAMLIHWYYTCGKSLREIADMLEPISNTSVANKMEELGLPTRSRGGVQNLKRPYFEFYTRVKKDIGDLLYLDEVEDIRLSEDTKFKEGDQVRVSITWRRSESTS